MKILVSVLFLFACLESFSQGALPYQKMKTPMEFEYIKAGKKLFLADTTEALACGDTNRVSVVNSTLLFSYRDSATGCAKWRVSGTVVQLLGDSAIAVGSDTIRLDSELYFDLAPIYLEQSGRLARALVRKYIKDSVEITRDGNLLRFPNGDEVPLGVSEFYNLGNTGTRLGQIYNNGFGISRLINGPGITVTKNDDSSITVSITQDYLVNQNSVKELKRVWLQYYRGDSARFDSYLNVVGNGTSTQNILAIQMADLNLAFGVRNNGTSRFGNQIEVYPISPSTGLLQGTGPGFRISTNTFQDRGFSFITSSRQTRSTDSTGLANPAGNVLLNENYSRLTGGTGEHTQLRIAGTINSNTSGIMRGLWIDQTITAAAEYRAIDVVTGTSFLRSINLRTAGDKINIATGSNASVGTATLVAGTVTVSTTAVTPSSKIFVSIDTPGGGVGFPSAPSASIVPGTSFVINSSSNTDASTVHWWIIN